MTHFHSRLVKADTYRDRQVVFVGGYTQTRLCNERNSSTSAIDCLGNEQSKVNRPLNSELYKHGSRKLSRAEEGKCSNCW